MTKVYVITGGSGGMGKEAARRFSKIGNVILADVSEERLIQAADELKSEATFEISHMVVDITNIKQVNELVLATSHLGELGAIIHTAGLSPTMAEAKRVLEVNSIGTANILNAFLPIAQQGSVAVCITTVTDIATPRNSEYNSILKKPLDPEFFSKMEPFVNNDSKAAYGLSKLGNILMVEDQAWEWGQKGARIVSISPGIFDTPMGRREAENQPEMEQMIKMTPLGRQGQPEEIAAAIEFLCSEGASYITGTNLRVDGGVTANYLRLRDSE